MDQACTKHKTQPDACLSTVPALTLFAHVEGRVRAKGRLARDTFGVCHTATACRARRGLVADFAHEEGTTRTLLQLESHSLQPEA